MTAPDLIIIIFRLEWFHISMHITLHSASSQSPESHMMK